LCWLHNSSCSHPDALLCMALVRTSPCSASCVLPAP
jgi:hypothetical protein